MMRESSVAVIAPDGPAAMSATFFALAFLAALNPKLFAVDLLLMENARPRLMLRVGFSAPPEAGWVRRQG